ncbi:MAG: DUF427 domain-containing protein [Caulobacterales bacterium]|nr:DUF427 domain-containing protein [Caulobacterales bacterium]
MFRRARTPGPDHPITAEPYHGLVRVTAGSRVIAESREAIRLKEANWPAIYYLPADSLRDASVQFSYQKDWCPYKGMARRFHLRFGDGKVIQNAGWTYVRARPAGEAILDRLAFMPGAVTIEAAP